MALHALRWVLLVAAMAPSAYYLMAIYCARDYFRGAKRGRRGHSDFRPPVSVLKPVRGMDRDAYENFASFCRQNYPSYEVLFAVAEPDDPVIPIIQKLQGDLPQVPVRLIVGVEQLGANRKLNNLARLAKEAAHEVLVINDSDVRVDEDYLQRIAGHFGDPQVGAVTAFFRGITHGSLGARLEALVLSTETVPNALVARKLEGRVRFAFGWTMATTKTHLRAIGGFEDMVNVHSDDFELGNRIAAQGLTIELLDEPVDMIFPNESFFTYLRHELRWAIGLRNVRPSGYWGLLFTFGLPWTILAVVLAPSALWALGYVTSYLFLRCFQVWFTGVWGLNDRVTRSSWWLVPLRDGINFLTWIVGFFTSEIEWRGIRYKVKQGKLIRV
ncbi:MAG TPA: bacteriohopanetetrol glucosamine biosynthesis glycosyltransferase HpnI [Candidatus Angelobacter sp.]|nr:bacteriohopanetetrol glucosamine biosynthesis glycosyltransferase HpnI [Candidatus Angelobacter sp.]